jgi:hypothetical protein
MPTMGRVAWAVIGVVYLAGGAALLLSRRLRDKAANGGASFHRAVHARAPWLYRPLPFLRLWEWDPGDPEQRAWRLYPWILGLVFVGVGLMAIFGVGIG